MRRQHQATRRGRAPDSYLKWILRFPLRPIRSDRELDQAVSMINALLDQEKLDRGEQDYLDVLSDLVEHYEEEQHPIPPAGESEMLAFLMDVKDLNQTRLAHQAGIASSTISEVLTGKRQLTRQHIEKLAAFFQIPPGVFLSA